MTGPTARSGTAGTDPKVLEKRCDREVRISEKLGGAQKVPLGSQRMPGYFLHDTGII